MHVQMTVALHAVEMVYSLLLKKNVMMVIESMKMPVHYVAKMLDVVMELALMEWKSVMMEMRIIRMNV